VQHDLVERPGLGHGRYSHLFPEQPLEGVVFLDRPGPVTLFVPQRHELAHHVLAEGIAGQALARQGHRPGITALGRCCVTSRVRISK